MGTGVRTHVTTSFLCKCDPRPKLVSPSLCLVKQASGNIRGSRPGDSVSNWDFKIVTGLSHSISRILVSLLAMQASGVGKTLHDKGTN